MKPRMLDFSFRYRAEHWKDRKTGEIRTWYYPYVPAILSASSKKIPFVEGLLDSGSDSIVIPRSMARDLGLELEEAPPMNVVGHIVDRFRSKLDLTLGRAGRFCEPLRDVEVSIPAEGAPPVIFGRRPIFELFRITFVEAEHRFTLEPYSAEVHRKPQRAPRANSRRARES